MEEKQPKVFPGFYNLDMSLGTLKEEVVIEIVE